MKRPTKRNSAPSAAQSFQVRKEQHDGPVVPMRGPILPTLEFEEDSTGLPFDSDAPSRRRPATRLAEALNKVMKAYHLGEVRNPPPAAMAEAWPGLAGPELSARLKIVKFERGILYASAESNADLYEIRMYHLRPLESRLKRHPAFATMRQLRVTVG